MRSMTGHGRGAAAGVVVEVRAVNHRHLDIKLRAPVDAAIEAAVIAQVRGALERGAVTVAVERGAGASGGGRIDPERARAAHAELDELARALGLAAPTLALVLGQPGVVRGVAGEPLDEAAVAGALAEALMALTAMRAQEGAALATELHARFAAIGVLVERIDAGASDAPARLRQRLEERIARAGVALDPARLAQEAAMLADRADVTEELVRLRSHLVQLAALVTVEAPAAVGRRLDFLIQEVGRELNTIGSKAPSAEIVTWIVDAKAELEKGREQAQNVE